MKLLTAIILAYLGWENKGAENNSLVHLAFRIFYNPHYGDANLYPVYKKGADYGRIHPYSSCHYFRVLSGNI